MVGGAARGGQRPLAFASADETIPTTHEPRFDSALGWRSIAIAVIASVALAVTTMAAAQTLRRRRAEATIAGRSPDIV
jgi:anti-sigma-K factor RskA